MVGLDGVDIPVEHQCSDLEIIAGRLGGIGRWKQRQHGHRYLAHLSFRNKVVGERIASESSRPILMSRRGVVYDQRLAALRLAAEIAVADFYRRHRRDIVRRSGAVTESVIHKIEEGPVTAVVLGQNNGAAEACAELVLTIDGCGLGNEAARI